MRQGSCTLLLVPFVLGLLMGDPVKALEPKEKTDSLSHKEFFKPELYISNSSERLESVLGSLPNREARESSLAALELAGKAPVQVFIDPRSGAATNVLGAFPLIPGPGVGNQVTLEDLGARTGRRLHAVDASAVAASVSLFAREYAKALGIDAAQLGKVRAVEVNPRLWQASSPQIYKGVPVRYGRLAATLNNGNLVLLGTETWGDVHGLSTVPKVSAEEAMAAGFEYADGRAAEDEIVRQPALEILPLAPPEHQQGEGFGGPVGAGYRHRLVWTFVFRRLPEYANWEVIVDAHDGEVLAMQDLNKYAKKEITGGVYPVTSTGICPTPQTCGTMQSNWPMPFADTGQTAPDDFANSAGVFNFFGGTATTTLSGKYVKVVDTWSCGATSNSSAGSIQLGGVNGDHDCTSGGGSAGNTAASRTAFYEVNKLAEMARGWLPGNTWLQGQQQANVNVAELSCNATWTSGGGIGWINFARSSANCRNNGEIAGVLAHEWGHGLDDNDANGVHSNSGEGYADIAAIYRLQSSCIGHGFYSGGSSACGTASDGSGPNANESQVFPSHCDLDCSGVRDADWNKHAGQSPDTALVFVCNYCSSGSGPCGRQEHCAAAPSRQAAWDFAARDLQASPFNLDSQSAFLIANRIFYQGSGNIGAWHGCTCGSSSSGCGAANGYMQWLAADDDNGNINDGTPHMTALYGAFNRHGIACASPTPANSGCSGGPATAPSLTVTSAINGQVSLSWNTISGATRYWVFRSEGHAGCNFGKTRIADVTGTTYTDSQVANGRSYYYNVVAAGSSEACHSRASTCLTVTPALACHPLTLTHTGSGANPIADPDRSDGCAAGRYTAGSYIGLTGDPDPGYTAGSWSGTDFDDTTAIMNSLTMPASSHTAAVHYVQPVAIGSYNFESDPGLTLTGLWHRTTACEAGTSGHSATTALYFGIDAQCDYDNASRSLGTATLPSVTLTGGRPYYLLTFNYFLDTEGSSAWDMATAELSDNADPYYTVAENYPPPGVVSLSDASGGWQPAVVDLYLLGSSAQVRFSFDTGDAQDNAFPGFYVDDVKISSVPACQTNPDLILTNQTVTTTQLFEACSTINASTNFVIGSGGNATFHAIEGVTLGGGFKVSSGGQFKVVVP